MKKQFVRMVLVGALVLLGAGMSFAGKGKGVGDGTGPIHDFSSGVYFMFTGVVIDCIPGSGLTLDLGEGLSEQIQGIGPVYYWESEGVDYPNIGDELTADVYTVEYNGDSENVAMSITIDGVKIQLRDPATGVPLWQGGNGASGGSGSGGHGGSGCPTPTGVSN
jgi:hypothetical protein